MHVGKECSKDGTTRAKFDTWVRLSNARKILLGVMIIILFANFARQREYTTVLRSPKLVQSWRQRSYSLSKISAGAR